MKSDKEFLDNIYLKAETMNVDEFQDSISIKDTKVKFFKSKQIKKIAPTLAVAVLALCIVLPNIDTLYPDKQDEKDDTPPISVMRANIYTVEDLQEQSDIICIARKNAQNNEYEMLKGEKTNEKLWSESVERLELQTDSIVFLKKYEDVFYVEGCFELYKESNSEYEYFNDFGNVKTNINVFD